MKGKKLGTGEIDARTLNLFESMVEMEAVKCDVENEGTCVALGCKRVEMD